MTLAIVQYIWELLSEMIKSILQLDSIFLVGGGFFALMTLFIFLKSSLSYESKLTKSVNKLNTWLLKNRTINEQNLVEFNNMIKNKKCPKILRKHWQQYMLYRDKMPSEYISTYNCIDKPSKTSSFNTNIKNYIGIYKITALITFFFSLISFSGKADSSIIYYVSMTLVTPAIIMLLGSIFTLILRLLQNHNIADLYQTFHIFTRYIDKASTTIPKYVDFEILFTEKEIKDGIPILGEYLEKRARQEQEELEEAQRNAVAHEEYNFAESGIDGSLMLERAMKESETYLNAKQRIYAEIQQFESEISTLQKNYENTSKDYQRKLQASKENMERLRQQQEESTNRIEINYIRKQQQDEVKKQEQLEHDQEESTNKFNTEINSLNAEIEKRKQDLESKRLKVQEAMESEYQTFSVKLHKAISDDVGKENDANIQRINSEKEQYAQAITYLKGEVDNKDQIILAKDQLITELTNRLELLAKGEIQVQDILEQESVEELEEPVQEEQFTEEVVQEEQLMEEPVQEEQNIAEESNSQDGHYDNNGYYWFNDGTYYDAQGLYHDLQGNVYDSEGNLQATNMPVEQDINQEEYSQGTLEKLVSDENIVQEEVKETVNNEQVHEPQENEIQDNEQINSQVEDQILESEDNQQVELEEQNEYEQTESYSENNSNEIVEQSEEQTEQQLDNKEFEEQEAANNENEDQENIESVQTEPQIGYDEQGNYRYKNGTYYDSNNLYHDLDGNVYNTEGSLVEENSTTPEITEEIVNEEQKNEVVEQLTNEETLTEDNNNVEETISEPESQNKIESEQNISEQQKDQQQVNETIEHEEILETKEPELDSDDKPKRGVGRPKKEVSEEELNKPKRSVGRPKKEVSEEELNKPKRRVGRPKKEITEEELNKPKRSVGRPKKEDTDTTAKPKRRAGRPKKEETEEQSTEILKHLGQSLLDLSEQKSKKKSSKKNNEE